MRDYKFRGKRKDNGEWVKGDLIRSRIAVEAWINTHNLVTRKGEFIQPVPVDPSTIGEFTGLKDKNGVEVYEGDVVRLDDGDTSTFSEVFFDGGALCVRSSGFTYEYDVIAIGWANENLGVEVEVIGNIHDNPELLEGGEQRG